MTRPQIVSAETYYRQPCFACRGVDSSHCFHCHGRGNDRVSIFYFEDGSVKRFLNDVPWPMEAA